MTQTRAPLLPASAYHEQRLREARATHGAESPPAAQGTSRIPVYSTWYPTLERTLLMLSKVYRCVEVRPFLALPPGVPGHQECALCDASPTAPTPSSAPCSKIWPWRRWVPVWAP